MEELWAVVIVSGLANVVIGSVVIASCLRLDKLEADQAKVVAACRQQVKNVTTLAESVQFIAQARAHWLKLVQ